MLSLSGLKDRVYYGWVVVVSFLIISSVILGIRFSFGVFFKSIEAEFALTRAATSSVFSTYMLVSVLATLIGGWALDKYGPRIVILLSAICAGLSLLLTSQIDSLWQLFIAYGLLFGMGSGAIFIVIMSTVSRWFTKKRGFALGLAGSGVGVGTVAVVPVSAFLVSVMDWRLAYLVLAVAVLLIAVPLSLLLKRDPSVIGALPDGARPDSIDIQPEKSGNGESAPAAGLLLAEAIRTRSYWMFMLTWLFGNVNRFLVLTHIVPYATDIGFSTVEAATVLSVIGVAATGGRIFMGAVADKIGNKLTAIISSSLKVVAMALIVWSHGLWMLYLFAVFFGIAWGGQAPSNTGLLGEAFGLRRIGTILGSLQIGFGLGAAIGPALGGYIFDINNSYTLAFILGGVLVSVRTVFIALIRKETGRVRVY